MKRKNLRIMLTISVCSALLCAGTAMSSCNKCGKKDDADQQKSESFIGSQHENTKSYQQDKIVSGQTETNDKEITKHADVATPPSNTDATQRKPTNDNDPNLRGYKYKYDKHTAYEDGIFSDTPDYIAIPAKIKDKPEHILFRKTYALSYNNQTKQANWVA